MIRISDGDFEKLVRQAVDELPEAFRARLDHVVIDIEPMPDRATARSVGLRSRRRLLGLFHGVPLTDRSATHPPEMPSRITIYRDNIRRICRTPAQVVQQVHKTVLHEIGHHFGLDEGDLGDVGYG